jgi:hypothetical protein
VPSTHQIIFNVVGDYSAFGPSFSLPWWLDLFCLVGETAGEFFDASQFIPVFRLTIMLYSHVMGIGGIFYLTRLQGFILRWSTQLFVFAVVVWWILVISLGLLGLLKVAQMLEAEWQSFWTRIDIRHDHWPGAPKTAIPSTKQNQLIDHLNKLACLQWWESTIKLLAETEWWKCAKEVLFGRALWTENLP